MAQLEDLLVRIERAWKDENDAQLVDRLAREHPEHSAQLYDFFDFLTLDSIPGPALVTPERLRKELAKRGVSLPPESWVQYLQERTGMSLRDVAQKLEHTRMEFLAMVSRMPQLVPPKVKEHLAHTLEQIFGLPPAETLFLLSEPPALRMAACKGKEPLPQPTTFAELLQHTGLLKKDREFWLKLGRDSHA